MQLFTTSEAAHYLRLKERKIYEMVAEGTVPMYFQGVKYNIPVAIWLPEQYPLQVGGRAGASAGLRVGARA